MARADAPFAGKLDLADVRVLIVTVRAAEQASRIRVRAPLYRRGINLVVTGASAGLGGAGGWWGGASLGGVIAGALGGAATALLAPAVFGAVAGGAAGLAAYRAVYRSVVRGGDAALRGLVDAVAARAEAEAGHDGGGALAGGTADTAPRDA
jgi:hypothetical protein